ncbi:MAG TPA: FHA domain-containing protein, partial [Anaerolineae bacterium]|nr:FHA domain-containing protein [Anaerolineae bacterium]
MTEEQAATQTEFLEIEGAANNQLTYQPIPENIPYSSENEIPVWRIRFEVLSDRNQQFGLDINGEIYFGRSLTAPDTIDMTPYGAETLGVSRRHLAIRPTATNLYVVDLGSTNGTMRNGHSIGINTPYSLTDGDILSLGNLQLRVHIVGRPFLQTTPL